ncbi:xylan 1,4-beta-xylosidase [Oscillibacter sp. MSJ-2]|uniref:Xylan 1,4-beta-xylosidase n=1 Tax=Dysosmobacter acutus TaxID=2841504 RepID=A0ABS6F6N8_9FIRM|nr:DUF6440 family protein [Dysosmobacter acutus]MBU5625827.1 xylan 1,4-beta-xylosidase [Dysosmobacter acutus]
MAKEKRFVRVFKESSMGESNEVWVDRATGVNYFYRGSGYGGGLTPLLGADGMPVVTRLMDGEE